MKIGIDLYLIAYDQAPADAEIWRKAIIEAAEIEKRKLETSGPLSDSRVLEIVQAVAGRGDVPVEQKRLEHYIICAQQVQGLVVCQVADKILRFNLLYVPPQYRGRCRALLACLALVNARQPIAIEVDVRTEPMERVLQKLGRELDERCLAVEVRRTL